MSRYFETNEQLRSSDNRQSSSSNRIVLPEFIPFTNDSSKKDQNSIPSPQSSKSRQHNQLRSPSFRNSDGSRSSDNRHQQLKQNGNKQSPRSREIRYHSPPQPNQSSYDKQRSLTNFRHNSRNRSRSPLPRNDLPNHQRSELRIHHQRNDRAIEYQGSSDRVSSERNRNGSVFDRMSSPPPLTRRRFGGDSRLSADSNSNGPKPHFFRTVNPVRGYDDVMYQNDELQIAADDARLLRSQQRERSPVHENLRYGLAEPEGIKNVVVVDQSIEIRSLRDRLIDAEEHCIGLERTVKSYEREIHKLHKIVNDLINDFEIIHARSR